MPQRANIGKIRYPRGEVEDVESLPPGTLWDVSSKGSRWVYPYGIIATPPNSSPSHLRTTLNNAKGDILVTFSTYGKFSDRLVRVYSGWFSRHVVQTQSTTPDRM